MQTQTIETTWGPIRLTFDNNQLIGCSLPRLKTTPSKPFKANACHSFRSLPRNSGVSLTKLGSKVWKTADEFFQSLESNCVAAQRVAAQGQSFSQDSKNAAGPEAISPKIEQLAGTAFQKAVWREMLNIPSGQTRTYGEIAEAIGRPRAVRAVGTACGANPVPLFIPCHRVVAKDGLGGFGPGLPWKTLLLKIEGAL